MSVQQISKENSWLWPNHLRSDFPTGKIHRGATEISQTMANIKSETPAEGNSKVPKRAIVYPDKYTDKK